MQCQTCHVSQDFETLAEKNVIIKICSNCGSEVSRRFEYPSPDKSYIPVPTGQTVGVPMPKSPATLADLKKLFGGEQDALALQNPDSLMPAPRPFATKTEKRILIIRYQAGNLDAKNAAIVAGNQLRTEGFEGIGLIAPSSLEFFTVGPHDIVTTEEMGGEEVAHFVEHLKADNGILDD